MTFPRRSRAERLALVWFCYMAGLAAASQLSQISVHPQLPKLFYESLEAAAILGHDRPADSVGSVAIEPHLESLHLALLHDSTAARVGALFQLFVQDTTAQDFGLPSSAIRLRM